MRIAIVSDVHSNLDAFESVLADADAAGAEAVWCLGDIVGYGPEPSGVIRVLREREALAVAGNHDRAACDLLDISDFNPHAASAVRWTADQLSADEREYLGSLPLTTESGDFTLVHGSLRSPVWEYLLDAEQAEAHLALQRTRYSVIGHSHLPFSVKESDGDGPVFGVAGDGDVVDMGEERMIFNPGSVGQPRDGDPRSGYILYDESTATVQFRRVAYDIASTQRKMCDAGLDPWLINRLAVGR